MALTLVDRLDALRARIEAVGDPAAITVVAVTKGFDATVAAAATAAGLGDLGENYAQELLAKAAMVGPVRWHFLGRIQRNKVAALAPHVALWQSVDRVSAAAEVARRAPGAAVLVQVNLAGDPSRPGCGFDALPALVEDALALGLDVRGVMGVAPPGPVEGLARPAFRRLRAAADALGLRECSMGMSGDLEVAVAEGSTMVRVGQALFGSRPYAGTVD